MRSVTLTVLVALAALAILITIAAAQRSTAQRDFPTTVHRDARGNTIGRSTTLPGGDVKHYDSRGNLIGTSSRR